MIDTSGMITVAETAERLHISQEQVRRWLRSGKLHGQRLGRQWFLDEATVTEQSVIKKEYLISREFIRGVRELRRKINAENKGEPFDAVAMIREARESNSGGEVLR